MTPVLYVKMRLGPPCVPRSDECGRWDVEKKLKLRVKTDKDDKTIKLNTVPIVLTLASIIWLTFYKKSIETWKNWRK